MDAAEVVELEVQCQGVNAVRQLLPIKARPMASVGRFCPWGPLGTIGPHESLIIDLAAGFVIRDRDERMHLIA